MQQRANQGGDFVFLVLLSLLLTLLITKSEQLHTSESLLNVKLQSCLTTKADQDAIRLRRAETVSYVPLTNVRPCVTVFTQKHDEKAPKKGAQISVYQSKVQIDLWKESGADGVCSITYKGLQSEYRLSPDLGLGHYDVCQKAKSNHMHWLGSQSGVQPLIENPACPYIELPYTYIDYLQCRLKPETWYKLKVASQSFVEYESTDGRRIEHDRVWYNSTEHTVFYTALTLETNTKDWMAQLVDIRLSCTGCECSVMLVKHDHWHSALSIRMFYRWLDTADEQFLTNFTLSSARAWQFASIYVLPSHLRSQTTSAGSRNATVELSYLRLCVQIDTDEFRIDSSASHERCVPLNDLKCSTCAVKCCSWIIAVALLIGRFIGRAN